jgi:hypothetical protein
MIKNNQTDCYRNRFNPPLASEGGLKNVTS